MKIKTIATTILVTLFLGSGINMPSAAETTLNKGAFSVGIITAIQGACPTVEISASLQEGVDTMLQMVSETRTLWPAYKDGANVVTTSVRYIGAEEYCKEAPGMLRQIEASFAGEQP